jgi:hypothetical protein
MKAQRLIVLPASLLLGLVPSQASAECIDVRPTGDTHPYAYGTIVESFAVDNIRVHYSREGRNAVRLASARVDLVPDDVVAIATQTAAASTYYASLGYRPPVAERADAPCILPGGDDKTDIYLVAFASADGQMVRDNCRTGACSSYILAEARLDLRYPSFEEGVARVLPHELFHVTQNAYASNLSGFFLEGTAQWASAKATKSDTDLRAFPPSFFRETNRALDVPPPGATASYIYGAAIWAVFLDEAYGQDLVREWLEAHTAGRTTLAAGAEAMRARGLTIKDVFAKFGLYNLATGKRASTGSGYAKAASYPEVVVAKLALDDTGSRTVDDLTSGFATRYYELPTSNVALQVTTQSDDAASTLMLVPKTSEGKPALDRAIVLSSNTAYPLPAEGGYLVASGARESKRDATYRLDIGPKPDPMPQPMPTTAPTTPEPPLEPPPAPVPSTPGSTNGPPAASPARSNEVSSGCHVGTYTLSNRQSPLSISFLVLLALGLFARARREKRSGSR